MTRSEARQMWDLAHQFWPPGSIFRYFSRHPEGRVFGCAISGPRELARLTDWADAEKWNSYWMPNPTKKRHGTRCSTEDITHWCWFMLDVDPIEEDASPWEALDEAEIFLALDRASALQIDSGRGMQGLYPLGPMPIDSKLAVLAPIAMRHQLSTLPATYGCVVDVSCTDLPRVMRLPYTVNQKTGRRGHIDQAPLSSNRTLADHLLCDVPSDYFVRVEPPVATTRASWSGYIPHLTAAAQNFLKVGAHPPGRHHAATATMLSLVEQGASQRQVLAALLFGASLCEPPLVARDVLDMVNRKFKKMLTVAS